ncbi:hypothetical protein LXA43DRAFT_57566 [Ganoderma leucocontextum]|nr:hypothetical protein LXA43DRAFT_57566 [Ganoderma leucocontextum]
MGDESTRPEKCVRSVALHRGACCPASALVIGNAHLFGGTVDRFQALHTGSVRRVRGTFDDSCFPELRSRREYVPRAPQNMARRARAWSLVGACINAFLQAKLNRQLTGNYIQSYMDGYADAMLGFVPARKRTERCASPSAFRIAQCESRVHTNMESCPQGTPVRRQFLEALVEVKQRTVHPCQPQGSAQWFGSQRHGTCASLVIQSASVLRDLTAGVRLMYESMTCGIRHTRRWETVWGACMYHRTWQRRGQSGTSRVRTLPGREACRAFVGRVRG